MIDDLLRHEERQIEGRQPDREDDQQNVEITRDPVDPLQKLLHRETLFSI